MKKRRIFITMFCLWCVISSCSIAKQSSTRSNVLINSYSPPCWQGITPGQTTKEKAIEIIEELSSTIPSSISEQQKSNDEVYSLLFWDLNSSVGGMLYVDQNEIVQAIELGDLFDFTYSAAIQIFGEPESITAFRARTETTYIVICSDFKNNTKGVSIIIPYDIQENPIIGQDTIIEKVIFYNPILANHLNRDFLCFNDSIPGNDMENILGQTWKGFGIYEFSDR